MSFKNNTPSFDTDPARSEPAMARLGQQEIQKLQEQNSHRQLLELRQSNTELEQEHMRMKATQSFKERSEAMGKFLTGSGAKDAFERLERPQGSVLSLTDRLKDIPSIGAERARVLGQLGKMVENADKPGFNAMSFVTNAVYELENVRAVLQSPTLSSIGEHAAANTQTLDALREEERFLDGMLTRLSVPHSPAFLAKFDIYGEPRLSKDQQELRQELATCGRVVAALACGSMVLLTGAMAYFANKEDPNFNATLVWMIPTALAVMGKDRIMGTEIQRLAMDTSFMQSNAFTSYVARHGNGLAGPVRNMIEQGGPTASSLNTLSNQKATDEQKTAAREKLREIMTGTDATSSQSALIAKLFEDEQSLVHFGRIVIDGATSTVTKEIVMNYIAKNRPPVVIPSKIPDSVDRTSIA